MGMKRHLYNVLIGIFIGLLICVAFSFSPRPDLKPAPAVVFENPATSQEQQADIVLTESRTTKVAGRSDPKTTSGETMVVIPVVGEVKTVYTDKRTDEVIGTGAHPVTGETQVIVTDDGVEVETRLEDTTVVAIDVPDPPPRLWEAGIYNAVVDGDFKIGLYVQRDFPVFKVRKIEMFAWIRGELEKNFTDDEYDGRLSAGIGTRW